MMMRVARGLAIVLAVLGLAVVAVPSPASASGWANCVADGDGEFYHIWCLGDGWYDVEIGCWSEPPNVLGSYRGEVDFMWRCIGGLDYVRGIPSSSQ